MLQFIKLCFSSRNLSFQSHLPYFWNVEKKRPSKKEPLAHVTQDLPERKGRQCFLEDFSFPRTFAPRTLLQVTTRPVHRGTPMLLISEYWRNSVLLIFVRVQIPRLSTLAATTVHSCYMQVRQDGELSDPSTISFMLFASNVDSQHSEVPRRAFGKHRKKAENIPGCPFQGTPFRYKVTFSCPR